MADRTEKQEKMLQTIMGLIMHGGDAKSNAMEAIQAAKEKEFEAAEASLKLADEALTRAHHSQTGLLTQEASGDKVELSLLLVHGQDHLMNAITFKDMAVEIVDLHKRLQ